jgi:hypothetical protein
VDSSSSANAPEIPPLATRRPDGFWWQELLLRAAARFGRTPGRSATLVLRRRPGLVARARVVADELDVDSTIEIGPAGPTISMQPRRRPTAPPSPPSIGRLDPVATSIARLRLEHP